MKDEDGIFEPEDCESDELLRLITNAAVDLHDRGWEAKHSVLKLLIEICERAEGHRARALEWLESELSSTRQNEADRDLLMTRP